MFLGGLEAVDGSTAGNPWCVQHIVDCRGDASCDRWHNPHKIVIPTGVSYQQLQINRLCVSHDGGNTLAYMNEFVKAFEPLVDALAEGKTVLIHCQNGKNRSVIVSLLLYSAFIDIEWADHNTGKSGSTHATTELPSVRNAIYDMMKLRALCQFTEPYKNHVTPTRAAECFCI